MTTATVIEGFLKTVHEDLLELPEIGAFLVHLKSAAAIIAGKLSQTLKYFVRTVVFLLPDLHRAEQHSHLFDQTTAAIGSRRRRVVEEVFS